LCSAEHLQSDHAQLSEPMVEPSLAPLCWLARTTLPAISRRCKLLPGICEAASLDRVDSGLLDKRQRDPSVFA
jgi:hypothetical protein